MGKLRPWFFVGPQTVTIEIQEEQNMKGHISHKVSKTNRHLLILVDTSGSMPLRVLADVNYLLRTLPVPDDVDVSIALGNSFGHSVPWQFHAPTNLGRMRAAGQFVEEPAVGGGFGMKGMFTHAENQLLKMESYVKEQGLPEPDLRLLVITDEAGMEQLQEIRMSFRLTTKMKTLVRLDMTSDDLREAASQGKVARIAEILYPAAEEAERVKAAVGAPQNTESPPPQANPVPDPEPRHEDRKPECNCLACRLRRYAEAAEWKPKEPSIQAAQESAGLRDGYPTLVINVYGDLNMNSTHGDVSLLGDAIADED